VSTLIASHTSIRIRYADTDQMKRAYYGKFFEYFEQGRSDLLRVVGMPYPEIEEMGYHLPVQEAFSKYHRSARYDDEIVVTTILRDIPQVRVRIEYEVRLAGEHDLLAEGYTVHGFVHAETGKPTRAPARFVEAVQDAFKRPVPAPAKRATKR
jgi:acyl-CoA thioester hydrolase